MKCLALRRGSAWAWAVAIVSVVVLGVIWLLYLYSYFTVGNMIRGTFESMGVNMTDKAIHTIDLYETVLFYLPVIILSGMVMWGIVYTLSVKEQEYPVI